MLGGHAKIGEAFLNDQRDSAAAAPQPDDESWLETVSKNLFAQSIGVEYVRLLVYKDFLIVGVIHSIIIMSLSYYVFELAVPNFLTVAAKIYDFQALSRRK